MREAIERFRDQLTYEPVLENGPLKKTYSHIVLAGMGGSALPGALLQDVDSSLRSAITIHRDYGLPDESGWSLKDSLVIASSYSGNTEETIDSFEEARRRGLDLAVIATGGKLLELAKTHGVPYVQLPQTGIQPRSALGFSMKALLKIIGRDQELQTISALAPMIDPMSLESQGQAIAQTLRGRIPVVYSSERREAVGYAWKIKLNETGKVPAFSNTIPEMNHNELNAYDTKEAHHELADRFAFIILKDDDDHPRVLKRIGVLETMYLDRGLSAQVIELRGSSSFHKIFSSLLLADWVAVSLAELYKHNPDEVPMVEEFKKLIVQ